MAFSRGRRRRRVSGRGGKKERMWARRRVGLVRAMAVDVDIS
jgi:hypothetical protein